MAVAVLYTVTVAALPLLELCETLDDAVTDGDSTIVTEIVFSTVGCGAEDSVMVS